MSNRDKEPQLGQPLDPLPVVTIQLPLYNEMYVAERLIDAVCAIDYPRHLLEIQVLDDSTDETRSIAELAVAPLRRRGHRREVHPPRGSHRVQGGRARGGAQDRARGVRRHLRRGLHADRGLPHPAPPALPRSEGRDGAGALGAHQPGLLAAHQDSGDPARRPLHPRTRRAQPRRPLLQFQRHRRRLASRRHRRSRRLAARHAHRGSRPELPRAAGRLAVRLRAGPHRARRSAGRDERLQVAAAPLGEGIDPDLPEAAAKDPEVEPADRREGGGVLPSDGELQLHPDVRALHPDVPVDGDPLQHGLVRDDPHRRPAVLRRDVLVLQFLHGVSARTAQGLGVARSNTCRS